MSAVRSGLIVRVAALRCALPAESVIETMRPLPVVALPSMPPYVLGASVIRAVATAVIDLRVLLRQPSAEAPSRFVALRGGRAPVALAVDAVEGLRALDEAAVGELPPLLREVAGESVASVGVLDGALLPVLERSVVLPEGLFEALAEAGG